MKIRIKISDLINRNFYPVWRCNKSHIVLKGGRSSMKSSVISLRLVRDFLSDPNGNVVCLRKIGKYLRTSVYEQIKWAIYMYRTEGAFTFRTSPLSIVHNATGTAFYFYGVDDPLKLKSMTIAKGYVMALWFEELAEFADATDIDVVEDTFLRRDLPGNKKVMVYFSYNPPRNPYDWVNQWVQDKADDPDYFIHSSTYMEDEKGFLSKQLIDKIERYKQNDYDYWRWMYNGEIIGLGDTVYNIKLFHWIDSLPDDDSLYEIDTGIDVGHEVSATTFTAYGLTMKGNVVLLDTYYYDPSNKINKKAPSELSADYWKWREQMESDFGVPVETETIDSAEGAMRNQAFKDYALRLHPVNKLKNIDMIDNVQDLLSQGRFFMLRTDRNKIFYEEHKRYEWDADTLNTDDPKVIKEHDHTVDAFKYFCLDNRRKLGLKY